MGAPRAREREHVDEACPISTEGWTRRVHFVREGEGGEARRRAAAGRLRAEHDALALHAHEALLALAVDRDAPAPRRVISPVISLVISPVISLVISPVISLANRPAANHEADHVGAIC